MDLTTLLFLASVFLFAVSVTGVIYLLATESRYSEKKVIRRRLLYLSAGGQAGQKQLAIHKKEYMKHAGAMERLAFAMPRIRSLDRMLVKTEIPLNASSFMLASIGLGATGALAAYNLLPQPGAAIPVGILCFGLPYLLLKQAERKSLSLFRQQFPEALDFLGRALRSGHALTGGLEMVAHEMPNPIKAELSATVDEINLGLSLKDALENLCIRVPCRDLRFFAISVQIQRETGGNLAEILDNIATLIRQRVTFHRQVKALTAEGRLSAIILLLLPVGLFAYLYVSNFDYLSLLWSDLVGYYMLGMAAVGMCVGALVMKNIVAIDM